VSEPGDRRETAYTAAVDAQTIAAPPPGSQLAGRYQVIATLGIGATGVVVQATDLLGREDVALKLLRFDIDANDEAKQRFFREAHATSLLRSEHAVRVREIGELADHSPFLAMELLQGLDVARLLVANRTLERAFAAGIAQQACDALGEAHSLGIIHRDVKPSNLFVTWRADRTTCVKVLDFGIAKAQTAAGNIVLTRQSMLLGTPTYMSPEQIRTPSGVDPRTDVWSLGIVLFEMVEGRVPFDGDNYADVCVAVAAAPIPAMTAVPELAPIVARCLAKDPAHRFQSMAEVAAALSLFV
jgi:serine/threonine-protein kinase